MELPSKPILKAWKLPTSIHKPPQIEKPLQILNVIVEKFEKGHDAQFKNWCKDMLEHNKPEHKPSVKLRENVLENKQQEEMHKDGIKNEVLMITHKILGIFHSSHKSPQKDSVS